MAMKMWQRKSNAQTRAHMAQPLTVDLFVGLDAVPAALAAMRALAGLVRKVRLVLEGPVLLGVPVHQHTNTPW